MNLSALNQINRENAVRRLQGCIDRARDFGGGVTRVARIKPSTFCAVIAADPSLIQWQSKTYGHTLAPTYEGFTLIITQRSYEADAAALRCAA